MLLEIINGVFIKMLIFKFFMMRVWRMRCLLVCERVRWVLLIMIGVCLFVYKVC